MRNLLLPVNNSFTVSHYDMSKYVDMCRQVGCAGAAQQRPLARTNKTS